MLFDFQQSAQRHFQDAELLRGDRRLHNADHLYGLSAECALKAVLLGCGLVHANADGDVDPPRRVHIDHLWNEYHTLITGRRASKYTGPLSDLAAPFGNWRIDQRYAPDGEVHAPAVNAHYTAARACMTVLERAVTNGDVA